MRNGLFLSALLASLFVSGAAMADRTDEDQGQKYSRGQQIKEQVLRQQREGHSKVNKESRASARQNKALESRLQRSRPQGDVYGDQATRSTAKSTASAASGRNMSATSSVNTPREIQQMLKVINPLYGAYRVSEAAEATDSYGGNPYSKAASSGGSAKNLSATGSVNTPAEIKQMLKMINPMHGAYRTSQASEGTDSYGGSQPWATGASSASTSHVHARTENGQVKNDSKANRAAAQKHEKLRENINNIVKAKMEKTR
jgi:hypothetical protein